MMGFRIIKRLSELMSVVSGFILVIMVLTVLFDVVTRAIFGMTDGAVDFTFRGGVEIIKYGLLIMVLWSLPLAVQKGQVIVDIFTDNWSGKTKARLAAFYILGFSVLGFAMALGFFESIEEVSANGETTQDLMIPMAYIYGLTAFGALMLGLRSLTVSIEILFAKEQGAQV